MLSIVAADLLDDAAGALEEVLLELDPELEEVAEPPVLEPAPAPTLVALRVPQVKPRQKVWPDKSFGWALMH